MKHVSILACAAALLIAPAVDAAQLSFNSSWKEQKFKLFSKNRYSFNGSTLGVSSDGTVSMAYAPVPEALWGSMSAAWQWGVEQSVPATDLRLKGGDDRNLAVYVVFLPEAEARALKGKSIVKLLRSDAARVLVYVWGGNHGRGKILNSPYLGARGKTVVLRNAGTGSHSEQVDLASDFKRAFGGTAGAVVGIAVSADSDDTGSKVLGRIANLSLE